MQLIKSTSLSISYSQFFVHDASATPLGLEWTERTHRQGFVRQTSVINVGALISHGQANLRVFTGAPSDLSNYERAIAVPLDLVSEELAFSNPDYSEDDFERLGLERGHYRVVIAQKTTGDTSEDVDVFLEPLPTAGRVSEILVADEQLAPELPLLEYARPAYP